MLSDTLNDNNGNTRASPSNCDRGALVLDAALSHTVSFLHAS